jgi:hypothetical protein
MAQKAGPPSSLKTGKAAGADGSDDATSGPRKQQYSVQCHTDERGLFVMEPISAASGDEAAAAALKTEGYKGLSVRGVTPYSDPDANSLGGEREAANMIRNAENGGAVINTLGTQANAEATRKLGKADIKELGE